MEKIRIMTIIIVISETAFTRQKYRGLEYGTPNCIGLKINSWVTKPVFDNISIIFSCVSDVCNKKDSTKDKQRILD